MVIIPYSGRVIEINNPQPEDIHIDDIAHHLAKTCRYGGALPLDVHYSVASHSMHLCAYAANKGLSIQTQRWALMHDATEAYLGDIISGLKHMLPDYQEIERKFENVIIKKYGINLTYEIEHVVGDYDKRIVLDELKALMPEKYHAYAQFKPGVQPLNERIVKDTNLKATKAMFLVYFYHLFPECV